MSGGIKTHVSGGHVQIGNIAQGSHNQLTARFESRALDPLFAEFFSKLAVTSHSSATEVAALHNEVAELQRSLTDSKTSPESLMDKAHHLYEKYGWAASLLKSLLVHLIPL
jgi:hypothetical protein